MKKEQQLSNTQKTVSGNKYEKTLYNRLKKDEKLKIRTIKRQTKFYYSEKKPEDELTELIKKAIPSGNYETKTAEKIINRVVHNYIEQNKNKPIRNRKKYHKRTDIDFVTEEKYLIDGKLRNFRIIIDTTTSARGDRIKAKAQDAEVYNSFRLPHLYFIVLPNDDYFAKNGYANPKNEIKNCKNVIYDNNFCNLYKEENVTLIMQEDDLFDFITYIGKRKEKDMNKLIENWKNNKYKDMYARRKSEIKELECELKTQILANLKK